MKLRRLKAKEGFSLVEVLVAITILGLLTVPICSSLVMSFRLNRQSEQLLQDRVAVSSVVETLMAEGIPSNTDDAVVPWGEMPKVTVEYKEKDSYYDVTVYTDTVSVSTKIRSVEPEVSGGDG